MSTGATVQRPVQGTKMTMRRNIALGRGQGRTEGVASSTT